MFRKKIMRFASFLLVFVMAAMLIGAGSAPAYALVGVDDAAFLYTLWSAFGLKAGVDITAIGGDAFTQDAITGLYNEWQNSRVSSGVQAAVSTLADFVNNVLRVGTLVNPGSAASGTLYTVLSLSAEVTEKLGQFWNWLIVDKLGGTSFDAVDFQQGSGNLLSGVSHFQFCPLYDPSISFSEVYNSYSLPLGTTNSYGASRFLKVAYNKSSYPSNAASIYITGFLVNGEIVVCGNSNASVLLAFYSGKNYADSTITLDTIDSVTGLYYKYMPTWIIQSDVVALQFNSIESGLSYYSSLIAQEPDRVVSGGSLTVAPDAGVDVLGFPDTGVEDYVPADTNIAINIPYDSTADLSDYIASGYDLALDNDLAVGVPEGVIEGTGTVGPVGDYVVPGLADVFPFCLPFDVYHFLEALAADPEAPHFTATLEFPEAVGGAQQIDIDFDNATFNMLASILRTLELLAFCVGLAFVTRSFFIRG